MEKFPWWLPEDVDPVPGVTYRESDLEISVRRTRIEVWDKICDVRLLLPILLTLTNGPCRKLSLGLTTIGPVIASPTASSTLKAPLASASANMIMVPLAASMAPAVPLQSTSLSTLLLISRIFAMTPITKIFTYVATTLSTTLLS